MGPRLCGELETMPADWTKALRDRRAIVDIRTHERGFSDGISLKTPKSRPNIRPHFPTVQKSTLIRRPHISHLSFVTNTRDNRKTRDEYER